MGHGTWHLLSWMSLRGTFVHRTEKTLESITSRALLTQCNEKPCVPTLWLINVHEVNPRINGQLGSRSMLSCMMHSPGTWHFSLKKCQATNVFDIKELCCCIKSLKKMWRPLFRSNRQPQSCHISWVHFLDLFCTGPSYEAR